MLGPVEGAGHRSGPALLHAGAGPSSACARMLKQSQAGGDLKDQQPTCGPSSQRARPAATQQFHLASPTAKQIQLQRESAFRSIMHLGTALGHGTEAWHWGTALGRGTGARRENAARTQHMRMVERVQDLTPSAAPQQPSAAPVDQDLTPSAAPVSGCPRSNPRS